MWSKKHSWATMQPLLEARTLKKLFLTFEIYLQVIEPFLAYVKFHMIPAKLLMTEVHPLGLVPYSWVTNTINIDLDYVFRVIMNALAYQADPSCMFSQQCQDHSSSKVSKENIFLNLSSSGAGDTN